MAIFSTGTTRTLVLIGTLFFLASCGDDASSDEAMGEEMSGEKMYQHNCISCHGKEGNLGVSGAADLAKSTKSLEEKIKIIKEGGPNGIMQAYGSKFGGQLNDDQIRKLAEYVETLSN